MQIWKHSSRNSRLRGGKNPGFRDFLPMKIRSEAADADEPTDFSAGKATKSPLWSSSYSRIQSFWLAWARVTPIQQHESSSDVPASWFSWTGEGVHHWCKAYALPPTAANCQEEIASLQKKLEEERKSWAPRHLIAQLGALRHWQMEISFPNDAVLLKVSQWCCAFEVYNFWQGPTFFKQKLTHHQPPNVEGYSWNVVVALPRLSGATWGMGEWARGLDVFTAGA